MNKRKQIQKTDVRWRKYNVFNIKTNIKQTRWFSDWTQIKADIKKWEFERLDRFWITNIKLFQSLSTAAAIWNAGTTIINDPAKPQIPLCFKPDLSCNKIIWLDDLSAPVELYFLRSLLLLLGAIHLAPEEYLTSKSGWMLHVVNEVTESSWNLLSMIQPGSTSHHWSNL